MLQNKQWEMRASRKHFDSHPVFLFRISTNLFLKDLAKTAVKKK